KEYRDRDFVLFSVAQASRREDDQALPFYPTWVAAQDFAARGDDKYWEDAKAHFNTLKRSLLNSPDLTRPDSIRLRAEYLEELKKRRKESVDESLLAFEPVPEVEKELRSIGTELDELDNL